MHPNATTDMSSRRERSKPRSAVNRQLEQAEARAREKDDNLIQLGKFFYSLAGMTYASAVLSTIMDYRDYKAAELYWGVFATALLTVFAWILIKIGNNKK